MTETSYPFDQQAVDEAQWSRMMRSARETGLVYGSRHELNMTNGSGLQVVVDSGESWVQGYFYSNDMPVALTILPNTSGLTRLDSVVLRLVPDQNRITLGVVEGTPSASPRLPPLVQTEDGVFESALWGVTVPSNIPHLDPDGFMDQRRRKSAAWTEYTPITTNFVHGNSTVTGRYHRDDNLIHFTAELVIGNQAVMGDSPLISLPFPAWGRTIIEGYMVGEGQHRPLIVETVGSWAQPGISIVDGKYPAYGGIGHDIPHTWTQNDVIGVSGSYETTAG